MPEPSDRDLELLRWLVKPFPPHLIDRVSKGGQGTNDVVPHHVVTQRLLEIVGAYRFTLVPGSQEHDDLPALPPDPAARSARARAGSPAIPHCLTGAAYRLEFEMEPGKLFVAEEYGDCGDAYNWAHNGERGKQIASDAIKRCGMRAGIALHAWAQKHYYLHESAYLRGLLASAGQQPVEAPPAATGQPAVRAGDAGPAQPQEDVSPAILEETVARSRPGPDPDPDPEHFDNEPAPEVVPEEDAELKRTIQIAAAYRATVMLEEQGGDLSPEKWVPAHAELQEELAAYFGDHPGKAQVAFEEAQEAARQPAPVREPPAVEPPGWEQPSTSVDSGWPQLGVEAAEHGEILSVQVLADQLGVHMVRACNALKQDKPEWKDKRVGWFANLDGADLAEANLLLREHYKGKEHSHA